MYPIANPRLRLGDDPYYELTTNYLAMSMYFAQNPHSPQQCTPSLLQCMLIPFYEAMLSNDNEAAACAKVALKVINTFSFNTTDGNDKPICTDCKHGHLAECTANEQCASGLCVVTDEEHQSQYPFEKMCWFDVRTPQEVDHQLAHIPSPPSITCDSSSGGGDDTNNNNNTTLAPIYEVMMNISSTTMMTLSDCLHIPPYGGDTDDFFLLQQLQHDLYEESPPNFFHPLQEDGVEDDALSACDLLRTRHAHTYPIANPRLMVWDDPYYELTTNYFATTVHMTQNPESSVQCTPTLIQCVFASLYQASLRSERGQFERCGNKASLLNVTVTVMSTLHFATHHDGWQ